MQFHASHQSWVRPGNNCRLSCYQLALSLAGNRSCSVALPTNSVSAWEPTLECSATNHFPLRRETVLVVSRYPLTLFPAGKGLCRGTVSTRSLSDWEHILQCRAIHQEFRLSLGKNLGLSRYQVALSLAGNRSCSVPLPTNSVSAWDPTLECCAPNQFSLRLGTHLVISG